MIQENTVMPLGYGLEMKLPEPKSVNRVGILGAGTIGASWAAHFLARGMDVHVWDPGPGSEDRAREFAADAWPALERLGRALLSEEEA